MATMHKHPEDMDGLDDYDRILVSDSDYSRPLYGAKDDPCSDRQLIEDVSRASAAHLLVQLPAIVTSQEGFQRLTDSFRTALLAYADALAGWGEADKPSNAT